LNSHLPKYSKNNHEQGNPTSPLNSVALDKLHSTETSLGDISQDLIKELTLKNKLLNAQLAEYKTLVANLNSRLQEVGE
jgi:hypothetical protein